MERRDDVEVYPFVSVRVYMIAYAVKEITIGARWIRATLKLHNIIPRN
jgi:hypothetical protein